MTLNLSSQGLTEDRILQLNMLLENNGYKDVKSSIYLIVKYNLRSFFGFRTWLSDAISRLIHFPFVNWCNPTTPRGGSFSSLCFSLYFINFSLPVCVVGVVLSCISQQGQNILEALYEQMRSQLILHPLRMQHA